VTAPSFPIRTFVAGLGERQAQPGSSAWLVLRLSEDASARARLIHLWAFNPGPTWLWLHLVPYPQDAAVLEALPTHASQEAGQPHAVASGGVVTLALRGAPSPCAWPLPPGLLTDVLQRHPPVVLNPGQDVGFHLGLPSVKRLTAQAPRREAATPQGEPAPSWLGTPGPRPPDQTIAPIPAPPPPDPTDGGTMAGVWTTLTAVWCEGPVARGARNRR
jgi:hypothetical protein